MSKMLAQSVYNINHYTAEIIYRYFFFLLLRSFQEFPQLICYSVLMCVCVCVVSRPYHALLLLDSEKALLNQLPLDCSPAVVRLIKTCSPVKNLQQLAQDADLALLQVQHSATSPMLLTVQWYFSCYERGSSHDTFW